MNVVLYGSGKRCAILIRLLEHTDIKISGVFDSDPGKWGCEVASHRIDALSRLAEHRNDYVCVTYYSSLVGDPIWEMLEKIGFHRSRIITFHELLLLIYKGRVDIKSKIIVQEGKKNIFDGSWPMGLGGVESWLNMIVPALNEQNGTKAYLATGGKYEKIRAEYLIDFCLYDTPKFSGGYVQKCINFLATQLPCRIVFSRVDELLLAAALVKEKYPDDLQIIMAVHGSCDGMYRDILSYRKYIDYYVCVSTGIKKELIKYGVELRRVEMMTCPVLYESNLSRKYSCDENEPLRIGYAGRLEIFEKRIDVLQNVILELEDRKLNYILDIAGDGTQFDELNTFIEKYGIKERVRLLGRLPGSSMAEFWKNHDIALNTSDNEGRPLSNMEAMAHGAVPVVTCTVGILDDVCDGINGYIVQLNDVKGMAEKICYLGEHRELLQRFGETARKEIIEKSSVSAHADQWKRILEKEIHKHDPLISVIVPIYNVEDYLRECLDSLSVQSYKNLEMILVDDGSTDSCGDICDEYAQKDNRFTVLHKENGGVVSARKAGMAIANGGYITFVDGDDWVDPDIYERIIPYIAGGDCTDIVAFGLVEEYPEYCEYKYNALPEGIYTEKKLEEVQGHMLMEEYFFRWGVLPHLCDKVFKKEILEECIRHVSNRISFGEDVACIFPCILKARSLVSLHMAPYHYRQRPGSAVKQEGELEKDNFLELFHILKRTFAENQSLNEQLKFYMYFVLLLKKYTSFSGYMPLFPFEKVRKYERIFVYGAGGFGKVIVRAVKSSTELELAGWTDKRHGSPDLEELHLDSYHAILSQKYDRIVIAILNEAVGKQVEAELVREGVSPEKIDYVKSEVLRKHDLPAWMG